VRVKYGRLIESTTGKARRQKAVDILLAVDALGMAARRLYDVLLLVAGDGDYVPILESVSDLGPLCTISVFHRALSHDLVRAADRVGYLYEDPVDIRNLMFFK
jgi:uncharacterized LabA/DUF88 family protein